MSASRHNRALQSRAGMSDRRRKEREREERENTIASDLRTDVSGYYFFFHVYLWADRKTKIRLLIVLNVYYDIIIILAFLDHTEVHVI